MKTTITNSLLAMAFVGVLSSCQKKSDREVIPENPGNYVIAVSPTAIASKADYLLTASSLESGAVSIVGNGVEQDGLYRYYVTAKNKFFSMLYGQGSPGAVTVYGVTDGKLKKLNDFTSATVQAFAPVNDDILMMKVPRRVAMDGATSAEGKLTSTKPSAITRIKSGTTEFDQTYFFNFEEVSKGYVITNWFGIGQNKFVANIEPVATKGPYVVGKRLAIVDVVAKTVTPVTGFADPATISSVTTTNYSPVDGKTGYVGVNLLDGSTYVYKVDASTAVATRGLKVEGGLITAIQHIK